MIVVKTGCRIHFGLFTPVPVPELDLVYGGVGIMVDAPGITVRASPSREWSVKGALSKRAEPIISRLRENPHVPVRSTPLQFHVDSEVPAHQGWGTGTQLALGITRVWCESEPKVTWSAVRSAEWVGRGLRSGIGIAGFDLPGLLIDEGKRCEQAYSNHVSTVKSVAFPPEWTWLLVQPHGEMGLFADQERAAFAQLPQPDSGVIKQLVEWGTTVLPEAAQQADFETFADTLTEYNRLAGSHYLSIQGGNYGSAQTAGRIAELQKLGAKGIGQSSWGPGIFALFPHAAAAQEFLSRCRFPTCNLVLAQARCNL